MPSKSVLKAFDTYASTFQKLNKAPIEWDMKNQRLIFNEGFKPLRVWYFNVVIVVFLGMFSCTWGIVIKQFLNADGKVTFFRVLILLGLGTLVTAALSFFVIFVKYGHSYVQGFNQLMVLETKLKSVETKTSKAVESHSEPAQLPPIVQKAIGVVNGFYIPTEHDALGTILIPLIHIHHHSIVSLTIFPLILQLDPFYFVILYINSYFSLHWKINVLLHLIRTLLILISAVEVCGLWPKVMLLFISHFIMIKNSLETIYRATIKISSINRNIKFRIFHLHCLMNNYRQLNLTMSMACFLLQNGTFILLTVGLIVCCLSNYGTIKFIGVVPIYFFPFFPFLSTLILFVVRSTLPFCQRICEISEKLKSAWDSLDQHNRSRTYLKRYAKGIQSLQIYSGVHTSKMLVLNKRKKTNYYYLIVLYTVEMLVTAS